MKVQAKIAALALIALGCADPTPSKQSVTQGMELGAFITKVDAGSADQAEGAQGQNDVDEVEINDVSSHDDVDASQNNDVSSQINDALNTINDVSSQNNDGASQNNDVPSQNDVVSSQNDVVLDLISVDAGSDVADTAAKDADAGQSDAEIDTAPPCPGATAKPDGTCCPANQSYDLDKGICDYAGPLGCIGKPEDCQPKWCLDWNDASGNPCAAYGPDCVPKGRACSNVEVAAGKGCSAGYVPALAGGCEPAGTGAPLPAGAQWAGDDLTVPAGFADAVAADKAVPPLAKWEWPPLPYVCYDANGPKYCATGGSPPVPKDYPNQCPAGFVAAADPLHCAPDPADCPADIFAGIQDGPNTVFVDSSFTGKPTGKRAAPYTAVVDAAWALKDTGGTLAIAAGSYPANIDTAKNLAVRGRCAAKTTLVGKAGQAVVHGGGGAAVTVQGLTVTGGTEMLRFDGIGKVSIVSCDVGNGERMGIVAKGGASVDIQKTFVHDLKPTASDGSLGTGIHADGGSKVTLGDVGIRNVRHRGLNCDDTGTACSGTKVNIDHVLTESKSGEGGCGVAAAGGASIDLSAVWIYYGSTAAALAYGTGTSVKLAQCSMGEITAAPATASNGHGGLALAGGKVEFSVCSAFPFAGAALRAYGVGSSISTFGSQFFNTNSGGPAMAIGGGAQGIATNTLLSGTGDGVSVVDAGSTAKLSIVHVTGYPGKNGGGSGISVAAGGSATLDQVVVDPSGYAGIYCANGSVTAQDSLILETKGADKQGGFGVVAQNGCKFTAKGTLTLDKNRSAAIFAANPGTVVDVAKLDARNTLPRESDGWGGRGVHGEDGATIILGSGSRLSANTDAGIWIGGTGTTLQATGLLIDGTLAKADGKGGHGIRVDAGASAKLGDTKILANREAGVLLSGPGAQLTLTGPLLVAGTLPRADGMFGRGVQVGGGAVLTAKAGALRVTGNAEAGVAVLSKGSLLDAGMLQTWGNANRGAVVQLNGLLLADQLQSQGDGQTALWVHGTGSLLRAKALAIVNPAGRGIEVAGEGRLRADRAVIVHALGAGVVATGGASEAVLLGARIAQTQPDGSGQFGHAGQAQDDGWLRLYGAEIAGGREAGVHARVGKAALAGAHVHKVLPLQAVGSVLGAAVIVSNYGVLQAAACRMEELTGAGVLVAQAEGQLDGVLVRQVAAASAGAAADALAAYVPNSLTLLRTYLAQAARAGLWVNGNAAAVKNSRMDGNGYGVATQNFAAVTLAASLVQGNGQNMAQVSDWPVPFVPLPMLAGNVVGAVE